MTTRTLSGYMKDESAQSTTEFVLLIALIGTPLFMGVRLFLRDFLKIYIENVIKAFTKGM